MTAQRDSNAENLSIWRRHHVSIAMVDLNLKTKHQWIYNTCTIVIHCWGYKPPNAIFTFLFFFKLSSPKHLCSTLYTKSDVFSFVVLMIYRLQGCTGNMRGCRYGDLYIAWSYASVCTMHRSLKQFTRTFVYCTVMRQNCKVTIYVIFQKEYFNHATLLLHSYFTNQ